MCMYVARKMHRVGKDIHGNTIDVVRCDLHSVHPSPSLALLSPLPPKLTFTRELPMGLPPRSCRQTQSSYCSGDSTCESPVRTPLYPSKYMRMVRPEIVPALRAAAQNSTRYATDDDRQGAKPPEVIMATFICSGMIDVLDKISLCVLLFYAFSECVMCKKARRSRDPSTALRLPAESSGANARRREGHSSWKCNACMLAMPAAQDSNLPPPRSLSPTTDLTPVT